jgi:hypothetical protein
MREVMGEPVLACPFQCTIAAPSAVMAPDLSSRVPHYRVHDL